MKISGVRKKLSAKQVIFFDVMPNPSDLSEWIVWIREKSGKSYVLVNEDESVVGSKDANKILSLLKDLGVKSVHIAL